MSTSGITKLKSSLVSALDASRALSPTDASRVLDQAHDLVSRLQEISSRPSRTSSWLLDLPDSIIIYCLQHLARSFLTVPNLVSVALTCHTLARLVQDQGVYQQVCVSTAIVKRADGDLGALLTLLAEPRFDSMRVLRLLGLSDVSTKLINGARYRKALPSPKWDQLQHLWVHNAGVLATVNHLISILPATLCSLSLRDVPGKWVKCDVLNAIADRSPGLYALDLGWAKASDPWRACLDTVASRLPRLLMLDVAYALYLERIDDDPATHIEALLPPLRKLTQLRYLDVSYLGLDGSNSHRDSRSDPYKLLEVVKQFPELRWLKTSGDDGDKDLTKAFKERAMAECPKLKNENIPRSSQHHLAFDLCVSGELVC